MATLRELRKGASDLNIPYDKTTTKDQLEELLAARLAEMEATNPPPPEPEPAAEAAPVGTPAPKPAAIVRTPVPAQAPPAPVPDAVSFRPDILINEGDLQGEFVRQGALYEHYARLAATAEANNMAAKFRRETAEAEMGKSFRNKFDAAGEKYTEAKLAAEVKLSPEVQKAMNDEVAALEAFKKAKALADGVRQRENMLIQLGKSAQRAADMNTMAIKDKVRETVNQAA